MTTEKILIEKANVAMLRLCKDYVDEDGATLEDVVVSVKDVLTCILESEKFRSRAAVVGGVSEPLTQEQRQRNMLAMGHVFFDMMKPTWEPGEHTTDLTVMAVVSCGPMKDSPWQAHFTGDFAPSGAAKAMRVTDKIAEVFTTLEKLWKLPGVCIDRSQPAPQPVKTA